MNTIELKVVRATVRGRELPVVTVHVDGVELTRRIEQAERPFAEAEGNPGLAGKYRGLWLEYVAPPSHHLLGVPSHPVYQVGDKTQILECECGEPGCWPFLCRITVGGNRVQWSDFEQPHRRGKPGQPAWEYGELGRFEFDRRAYEAALARLAAGPDS